MSVVDLKKLKKSLLVDAVDKKYGRYKFLHDLKEEILFLVDQQNVGFAAIARTLKNQGHSVSAITISRYYRNFKNTIENNKEESSKLVIKRQNTGNSDISGRSNKQHSSSTKRTKNEQKTNKSRTETPLVEEQRNAEISANTDNHNATPNEHKQLSETTIVSSIQKQISTKGIDSIASNKGQKESHEKTLRHGSGTGHFKVEDDDVI